VTDALTCAHCEGDIHPREHHHCVTTEGTHYFHTQGACHVAAMALYRRGGSIRLLFSRRAFDNKRRG
jgi:hypothetical protein